jgi:serine/threonine-protein phosphatase 4 regulatory subunit 1
MYRVRKACADSISDISKSIKDNDIKNGVLVPIFLSLTQDPSKAVKQSALQQLGLFISTLAIKDNIRLKITMIAQFNSMVNDPTGDPAIDSDLKYYCAYHFPGVLQTVGVDRWPHMKEVFKTLAASKILIVQQTIAYSLHEVARLVYSGSHSVVDDDLVSIFEDMIQDGETIQSAIIKYIASFLETLPQSTRVSYLPLLHDILHSTNPFNWRLRQCLALQLPKLVLLPPVESVYESLFPLAMTLLQDPVSCVRKDSYSGIAKLIQILFNHSIKYPEDQVIKKHLQLIATAINSLATGETYQMRQLWIELCIRFLLDMDRLAIETYFIDVLASLACDPVCNVRVSFASLLSAWTKLDLFSGKVISTKEDLEPSNWAWLLSRQDIINAVGSIATDDIDVYTYILPLKPLFPNLTFSIVIKKLRPDEPIVTSSSSASSNNISLSLPVPKKLDHLDASSTSTDNNNFVFDLPNIDFLPDEFVEPNIASASVEAGNLVKSDRDSESKIE